MKKQVIRVISLLMICCLISNMAYCLVVHDPINAAISKLRNTLIQNQHIQVLRNAIQQLQQLEATYRELIRFHEGIDRIKRRCLWDIRMFRDFMNEPTDLLVSKLGYEITPGMGELLDIIQGRKTAYCDVRTAIEQVFGADPRSPYRPYISYQEVQIGDSLAWAGEVKQVAEDTKDVGRMISDCAASASPKGAARLSADALGKLLITQAQVQQNQGKLIELEANLLEYQIMQDKALERERLKYMEDFQDALHDLIKL